MDDRDTTQKPIRDLDSAELVKNIYNYMRDGLLDNDSRRYVIITAHPADAINLKRDFEQSAMSSTANIGEMRDFDFMGYQFYLMKTYDIEVGKWTMTVGRNYV
jgi:hypothetical protein